MFTYITAFPTDVPQPLNKLRSNFQDIFKMIPRRVASAMRTNELLSLISRRIDNRKKGFKICCTNYSLNHYQINFFGVQNFPRHKTCK